MIEYIAYAAGLYLFIGFANFAFNQEAEGGFREKILKWPAYVADLFR